MPSTSAAEEKRLLRAQVRLKLSELSVQQLREGDEALFDHFLALP